MPICAAFRAARGVVLYRRSVRADEHVLAIIAFGLVAAVAVYDNVNVSNQAANIDSSTASASVGRGRLARRRESGSSAAQCHQSVATAAAVGRRIARLHPCHLARRRRRLTLPIGATDRAVPD
jgi:hypothetical protein